MIEMNTIVAVPFDETLAEFIGKKGSENSITFYNRKHDENVIVALMPSSIEEKFYALPQAMLMASQIIVSTRSIDKIFGEALIACALLNKRTIFTKENDISKILAGITLQNFSFADREQLLDSIFSFKPPENEKKITRIDVDKAFNVKGVGMVVLGVVTKGTVKVHDTLYHNSGKVITVRSIQSQDQDVKEAGIGTRVGLALKGIEEGDIQKGDTLATAQIKSAKTLEIALKKSGFVNELMEIGKMYSIAIGFSYVFATVEKIEGNNVTIRLEKSIPAEVDDDIMMVRTVEPRIFASGRVLRSE